MPNLLLHNMEDRKTEEKQKNNEKITWGGKDAFKLTWVAFRH